MTSDLRADCSRCVGLCCVAPAFTASADFALTKPAGTPCPNLQADFSCGIHTQLRLMGFPGCTGYDCFGAGQRVTASFSGQDWLTPSVAGPMLATFEVVRALHELLWYLNRSPGSWNTPAHLSSARPAKLRNAWRGVPTAWM